MIKTIQKELFLLQDKDYRDFNSKLIPTLEKEKIIGVRTPLLRKYAKDFAKSENTEAFLSALPHKYYEENNLHALLILRIKDFDRCVDAITRFLPYIDNWATCDMMSPKVLKKNPDALLNKIREWIESDRTYTVRYGIKCLMDFYLDENFSEEILFLVAEVSHEDYYVKMVQAWFFATALYKQYDATIPFIEKKRLSAWVHNKTIQKAIESYRIEDDAKTYLKQLKIKKQS